MYAPACLRLPFQKMDATPSAAWTTATCVQASSGKYVATEEDLPEVLETASVCFEYSDCDPSNFSNGAWCVS